MKYAQCRTILHVANLGHLGRLMCMGGKALQRIVRSLTDEEKFKAIDMASAGQTLKQIQEAISVDESTFWHVRQQDLFFAKAFALARQEGLEQLADSLITIPDTYENVLQARLKSENIKWLLSKRKAEVYGDKLDLTVRETVDLSAALQEARNRTSRQVIDLNNTDDEVDPLS